MSSQIEGTQATLEDVLDPMLDANTNRNVADVVNYIKKATEFAINRLQTLPLCIRLIKETPDTSLRLLMICWMPCPTSKIYKYR